MVLTHEFFATQLQDLPDLTGAASVAVGVSGGPDSMALCCLLSRWAKGKEVVIHALIVDHGLRPEAAAEASAVAETIKGLPAVHPVILRWEGEKPESRILEEARQARYGLFKDHMKSHGIRHLFVAHHQDDQAETFLIRLAKGSGLDGLAAMQPVHSMRGGEILLCRPLLPYPKKELIAFCREEAIPFVEDPTNQDTAYLRPRLRASRTVLEEEGLSSKRLAVTAARLARAREALDIVACETFENVLTGGDEKHGFLLDWSVLRARPSEIILRVLTLAMDKIGPERAYGPRMERLEALVVRICNETDFRGATLAGCRFYLDRKQQVLHIAPEKDLAA